MYVCLCKGVTDSKLKKLIADGARNLKDIQDECEAGMKCGACVFEVRKIIEDQKNDRSSTVQTSPSIKKQS